MRLSVRCAVARGRVEPRLDARPVDGPDACGRDARRAAVRAEGRTFLGAEISLAVVNAPGLCVFSGPHTAIDALTLRLSALGVQGRKLHTSAFHSSMMDPIVRPFVQKVQSVRLNVPRIPYCRT